MVEPQPIKVGELPRECRPENTLLSRGTQKRNMAEHGSDFASVSISVLQMRLVVVLSWARGKRISYLGFTLIELVVSVAIVATLTAIAVPQYKDYIDRMAINQAILDIRALEKEIALFEATNGRYPYNLVEINRGTFLDPWGNPYQYLDFATAEKKGNGEPKDCREDGSTHPINTNYDLYSMGKDGQTDEPLTAQASHDDIVRANDGTYVGLANDFT